MIVQSTDQIVCLSEIYDTVLDARRWPRMLDVLARAHGGVSATALAVDDRYVESAVNQNSIAFPLDLVDEYVAHHERAEAEAYAALFRAPRFQWMRDDEAFRGPLDEQPSVQWLREKLGIWHRAAVRLNDNPAWRDAVVLQFDRAHGPIRLAEQQAFAPLLPHLARLFALNRPFQIMRARFRAVVAALDRFGLGVIALSETGAAIVANREAQRILDRGHGLRLNAAGRLLLSHPRHEAEFNAALAAATETARGEGFAEGGRVVLPRDDGRDPILIEISALRGDGDELDAGLRGALVLLIDPDHRAPVSVDGMAALYGLTDAEAVVLRAVIDGLDAPAIAETRSTSVATVRTQLRAIADKTGAPNRAALVRLALTVNPPVERADAAASP